MTAQISDSFLYQELEYTLIGVDKNLFSPRMLGLKPTMISTACYRGFYCTYEISDKGLFLIKLTIRTEDDVYPEIDNIRPHLDEVTVYDHIKKKNRKVSISGAWVYEGLQYFIPYVGKLRLARDFIEERYVHMGFQDATSFETVIDLTFQDGMLIDFEDRSDDIQQLREIQAMVNDFMTRYRLDQKTMREIEERYGIPTCEIPDTFSLRIKDIDLNSIKQYLAALQKCVERPWWFVAAINNHYKERHNIHDLYSFQEVRRLGLPDGILNILKGFVDTEKHKTSIILSFFYALTQHEIGSYFEEITKYVIGRKFENNVKNKDLILKINPLLNPTTHDSWNVD